MSDKHTIHAALQTFADAVKAKMALVTPGEAEDQLRGPFENFMADAARALGWNVVCKGETPLPGRLGKPDYGVHLNRLLSGYVELKAPGVGANPERFTGHNRDQWRRFSGIPNILYADGNEWGLYRSGKRVDKPVSVSGDVATEGKKAVGPRDAQALEGLLRDFLSWEPIIPRDRKGKIDLKRFAEMLAPLCRMLRQDVTDALLVPDSPLVQLAGEWRQLLFPDASDEQFADSYAQTVTFALLLGRSEGAEPLTLERAEKALAAQHSLLSRALQVLTDPQAQAEIEASLDLLLRVIAVVPPATLTGPEDPWLYFYEDFLAVYDRKLRKDAGAYYTPVEVVHAQVRLIDDLLVNRLGKPLGFADPDVITLDPAAGTGTYLLGAIEHALGRVEREQGTGAVPGQATTLARNLYAFEILVGPFAVTELRVTRALRDRGATLPEGGSHVYLTDTLESPDAVPPPLPLFLKPIAEQHARALEVKSKVPVIVCLGNPPYDRHEAVDVKDENKLSRYGGWVRFGDPPPDDTVTDAKGKERKAKSGKARLERRQRSAILKDFLDPALAAGHGVHLKWLYNLYVYFWRWALWKVFEQEAPGGPGVVSFITAASYLFSDAFVGMREHMRRICDEIWILDIAGEARGGRRSDNIFAIQVPVAIGVAVRYAQPHPSQPARVHFASIEGNAAEKLAGLDRIMCLGDVEWRDCPTAWHASFRPKGEGTYFVWPLLLDLLPWQHSGSQLFRTWPVAPSLETIERRWHDLLMSDDRALAFRESRDRKITGSYPPLTSRHARQKPIAELPMSSTAPEAQRYALRSFDRQWVLADSRLGDVMRPTLWETLGSPDSSHQVFLATQMWQLLGNGPALVVCACIPDFHFFCGRGSKDILPMYRAADASEANVLPGLLDQLAAAYKRKVTPEDFLAYVYGVLAQPAFTARYAKELETRELRVPITRDATLFEKVRETGARLLWLHTYGERFVPEGKQRGRVPRGQAKCIEAVPSDKAGYPESFRYNDTTRTLHVGAGEFRPVAPEVYEFEVSGLKVVQSWLKYRMKKGAGKKSSPLDDIRPERWTSQFTTELLELLWVLEATVAGYPEQAKLLEAVVAGPCFRADELPPVPDEMRKPPAAGARAGRQGRLYDDSV